MVASQLSLHRADLKLMPSQFYNPQVATFRTIDKAATHKLLSDSTTEGTCKEQVIPIFLETLCTEFDPIAYNFLGKRR